MHDISAKQPEPPAHAPPVVGRALVFAQIGDRIERDAGLGPTSRRKRR